MGQEEADFERNVDGSPSNHIIGAGNHSSNWFLFNNNNNEDTSFCVGHDNYTVMTADQSIFGGGDGASSDDLLRQAQMLLAKSDLFQKIDLARQQLASFRSGVYEALPRTTSDDCIVTATHRDTTVASLRFLNIFCNCNPSTFALAASLLDRLVGHVRVHPSYMSSIGTCCFYIAAKMREPPSNLPDAGELLKLSRCGGTLADLRNTERLICDTLRGTGATDITALHLLQHFYSIFELQEGCAGSAIMTENRALDAHGLTALIAKLEVLTCQFEFTRFKGDVLALALLSYDLQERGVLNHPDQFALIVELQYYCQMSDVEFIQCRGMIIDYLGMYHHQPTKLPRLQLAWTISRRTLHKMKPSTRVSQDLEPIIEDEDGTTEETDEDDSGPFDSENDEMTDVRGTGSVGAASLKIRTMVFSQSLKYDWMNVDDGSGDDALMLGDNAYNDACNDHQDDDYYDDDTKNGDVDDDDTDIEEDENVGELIDEPVAFGISDPVNYRNETPDRPFDVSMFASSKVVINSNVSGSSVWEEKQVVVSGEMPGNVEEDLEEPSCFTDELELLSSDRKDSVVGELLDSGEAMEDETKGKESGDPKISSEIILVGGVVSALICNQSLNEVIEKKEESSEEEEDIEQELIMTSDAALNQKTDELDETDAEEDDDDEDNVLTSRALEMIYDVKIEYGFSGNRSSDRDDYVTVSN